MTLEQIEDENDENDLEIYISGELEGYITVFLEELEDIIYNYNKTLNNVSNSSF